MSFASAADAVESGDDAGRRERAGALSQIPVRSSPAWRRGRAGRHGRFVGGADYARATGDCELDGE